MTELDTMGVSVCDSPQVSGMDIPLVNPLDTTKVSRTTRMAPMSNFGARLKRFRDARGWSQERVGFELEVTKATISKWETGRAEPGLSNLAKIRRLYSPDGLTLDYLIDDAFADKSYADAIRYINDGEHGSARQAKSTEETALLTRFRALTSARRRGLLDLLAE